jgi:diguanylate cyclase (GGDEF)-like protein
MLFDITRLLVSQRDPERVLEAVAVAMRELVPYDTLTIFRADPGLRVLRPVLVRDLHAQEILAMGALSYGLGITGTVAESGVAQLVNDVDTDPRSVQVPGTPDEPESLMSLPMLAAQDLKGVMTVNRLGPENHFTDEEFDLAMRFAEVAALSIDHADIRTELERQVVTDHLTGLYNHRHFQERLAEEVRRANRRRSRLGLVIFDIDDFKRVNDTFGHLTGDAVLKEVSAAAGEACRAEDVLCRIGGEEFAVILPGTALDEAAVLAERIRRTIAAGPGPEAERVTVSIGVAEAPGHASSPRELVACADHAMREAKAGGKNRVRLFGEDPAEPGHGHRNGDAGSGDGTGAGTHARLTELAVRGQARSSAELRVLQSLTFRLVNVHDVTAIGQAVAEELQPLIDYHNCRVYILEGRTLMPVAFRGVLTEYEGETFEALLTDVDEGVTGKAARTGLTVYVPNSDLDGEAVQIAGTPSVVESILAVPLLYGKRVVGTIVVSKLGIDQFDEEDLRLLQAIASTVGVAFENARLLDAERRAADRARQLLSLSRALTTTAGMASVIDEALEAIPRILPTSEVAVLVEDDHGSLRVARHRGLGAPFGGWEDGRELPPEAAAPLKLSSREPFVMPRDLVAMLLPDDWRGQPRDVMVAPIRWSGAERAAIIAVAPSAVETFGPSDLEVASGIADITSLALRTASRFDELRRTSAESRGTAQEEVPEEA